MNAPQSRFLPGEPRLHYLEWNNHGARAVVLLHGNAANAWWWCPFAAAARGDLRLIALDMRGHGDSEWVCPPAYQPADYAQDLRRLILALGLRSPVICGHSMGGLVALAFACVYAGHAAGLAAVDTAIVSSEKRDRFLRRLKSLPTVNYSDLVTAKKRFRLIPYEGEIPLERLDFVAERSLSLTNEGLYSLKFDRQTFFGGDGLNVLDAIGRVRCPLLLARGALSPVMTRSACKLASEANPLARLVEIPNAHHHVPLEQPERLAREIAQFVEDVSGSTP